MKRLKNALDVISTIVVIVAGVAFVWTVFVKQPATAPTVASRPLAENVKGTLDASQATNRVGTGRVAIVEFTDYQCPFCQKHVSDTLPAIRQQLVASGLASYFTLNFPLERIHALSVLAGEAAECAARQSQFVKMHETLFANQQALTRPDLSVYAKSIGLNIDQFDHCLDQHESRDKVLGDQATGRKLGVSGTPAFFIGVVRNDGGVDFARRINGTAPFETFAEEVKTLAKRHRDFESETVARKDGNSAAQ